MDRYGTGLARPLRYVPGGFVTLSGPPKVLQSIESLVGIPLGSVPWRCKLGTRVGRLRHRNNTSSLRHLARIDVNDGIQRWEPRFRLFGVTAAPVNDGTRNLLDLTISGEVVGQPGKIETVRTSI